MELSCSTKDGWTVFEIDDEPIAVAGHNGVIFTKENDFVTIHYPAGFEKTHELGDVDLPQFVADNKFVSWPERCDRWDRLVSDLLQDFMYNYEDPEWFESMGDALDMLRMEFVRDDQSQKYWWLITDFEEARQRVAMAYMWTMSEYELPIDYTVWPPATVHKALISILKAGQPRGD